MLDTADGALQESQTVLLRMRELAVQSANGTLTDADRDHTDAEFQQLVSELTRIADNTTFAGQNLLNGATFSFQIGEGANQTISVSIYQTNSIHYHEFPQALGNVLKNNLLI